MNQLAFNQPFNQPSFPEAGKFPQQPVYNNYYGGENPIDPGRDQALVHFQDGVNYHAFQRPGSGQSAADARLMQQSTLAYNSSLHAVPAQASQTSTPPTRQVASPAQHLSPNNAASQQPQRISLTPPANPSHNNQMAAPQISSQSPGTASSQHQTPTGNTSTAAALTPTTPQSPTTASREQSRVALILSINQDLLAEINRLQTLSQGGAVNPQQAAQLRNAGQSDKMASEDYIQLLRRVQGNLAYLMPRANNSNNNNSSGGSEAGGGGSNSSGKMLPGPAFMQHPPQLPGLREKYERLRELFPDWVGNDAKLMAMSAGGAGAGSPTQQSQQQQAQQAQQRQGSNGVS